LSYDIFVQGFQDGKAVSVTAPRVWELLEAAWEQPPDRLHHALVRRGDAEADLYAGPAGQPIDSLISPLGRRRGDLRTLSSMLPKQATCDPPD